MTWKSVSQNPGDPVIKGIQRLKRFGVYDDYSPPLGISDFAESNIIYGWNYSGKTTISRVFQCLETGTIPDDLDDSLFEVRDSNDQIISNQTFGQSNHKVCVFNSHFTDQNLHWDGSDFNPILLLGDESIEAEKQIESKTMMLERCRDGFAAKRRQADGAEKEVNELKTQKAADIKKKLKLIEAFSRTHVNQIISQIEIDPDNFVLDDETESSLLKKATASDSDKLPAIQKFALSSDLTGMSSSLSEELKYEPALTNTISYLTESNQLADWVRKGLELHAESEQCKFCENQLSISRKAALNAHFSKDLTEHEARLNALGAKANAARIEFKKVFVKSFYPVLQDKAESLQGKLEQTVVLYNEEVGKVEASLSSKLAAPFDKVPTPDLNCAIDKHLADNQEAVNLLIAENNNLSKNFHDEKVAAITQLKKHYVASFLVDSKLMKRRSLIEILRNHREKYQQIGEKLSSEIKVLEAQISEAQKGREELNQYITKFLNGLHIHIDVIKKGSQERFILMRGDKPAKNLSEGEKTAIAFAFFLVKLKERDDYSDLVVFIDDPVSSLDSNHLFQIYAVIQQEFFYKDEQDNGKWKLTIDQLFCSTHNFEFFGLLKKLPINSAARRKFFFVKRISATSSSFDNLPKSIELYDSEYHYLWSVIKSFNDSEDKADLEVLLAIPNAVRRFVELYTYSKIPSTQSISERASQVFGAERSNRILKVLHHFSHSTDIYGISQNDDLICDIESCVNDLVEQIASDEQHYAALMQFV